MTIHEREIYHHHRKVERDAPPVSGGELLRFGAFAIGSGVVVVRVAERWIIPRWGETAGVVAIAAGLLASAVAADLADREW